MLTVNIATLRDIRVIYDKLSKTIDGEPLFFYVPSMGCRGLLPSAHSNRFSGID